MSIALITIASGRHQHLRAQRASLTRSTRGIDQHIVVAMDDPHIAAVAASVPVPETDLMVVDVPRIGGRLPLAHARNAGARVAIERGAELLVFLDVDCLAGDRLVERYAMAVRDNAGRLCSGPVAYLPPASHGYDLDELRGITAGHPARPTPDEDAVQDADPRLFWTLSFAVAAEAWRAIGGFCQDYVGYGGEDTDFGQLAASHGIRHVWVGGAWAYHQHHPTTNPPVQHLDDILRNATIFHRRWGWWPMIGWLEEFRRQGVAQYDASCQTWSAVGRCR